MTDVAEKPILLSSTTLATMLNVSRGTIHKWRMVGYLPLPALPEAGLTVWNASDVDEWLAGGCKWARPELAKEAAEALGGMPELRGFIQPRYQPDGPSESARCQALLDGFERRLNECDAMLEGIPSETDVRSLVNRMASVRREIAVIRAGAGDEGANDATE
ncbi:MAG: helix-turn-helix domain-containing protein [Planctomycetota bacterium]